MFRALATAGVEILLVTTSEIKVACLVDRSALNTAVQALHSEFVESIS